MALTHDTLDIVRLLCDVTLRMIEGELYQLTKNGDVDITEDEHFDIIRRKTAYLFGGCAQIGGMLGEVDARAASRRCASTASTSASRSSSSTTCSTSPATAEALGKPVGGDLREGKMTLPLIHLLRARRRREAERIVRDDRRDRDVTTESSGRELQALLARAPLDRLRLRGARSSSPSAPRSQLRMFPPSSERDALMALARLRALARPLDLPAPPAVACS